MVIYNKKFKKDYKKIFKKDPLAANMMLLFLDLSDENGQFCLEGDEQEQAEQISQLMDARFDDPTGYQL